MNFRPGLRLALVAVCLAAGAGRAQYLEAQIPVGESPQQCLWNPISNKVYVSNEQDGTVTVIDGATNEVRATIAVADYPYDICLNTLMNKVYVASRESNRLNVIDGSGDSLIREVSIPHRPGFMTFNVSMNKTYVAYNDDPYAGIAVLDGTTDDVRTTIPIRGVRNLLWVPTTNRVLCYTDVDEDTVKAIDCVNDQIAVRLPFSTGLDGLGVWCHNPANDRAYLSARWSVYSLTPAGDSVVAVVPKPSSSSGTQLAAIASLNRVAVLDNGWMLLVDGVSNLVTCSLYVGGEQFVCDTVKLKAYCSDVYQNGVHVVDVQFGTMMKTIDFGTSPFAICCNTTNSRVYIADYRENVVFVVRDTSTAVAEPGTNLVADRPRGATVTRGPLCVSEHEGAALYCSSGLRVAALRAGWNDISRLARGTYFLRALAGREVTKVILTK